MTIKLDVNPNQGPLDIEDLLEEGMKRLAHQDAVGFWVGDKQIVLLKDMSSLDDPELQQMVGHKYHLITPKPVQVPPQLGLPYREVIAIRGSLPNPTEMTKASSSSRIINGWHC